MILCFFLNSLRYNGNGIIVNVIIVWKINVFFIFFGGLVFFLLMSVLFISMKMVLKSWLFV